MKKKYLLSIVALISYFNLFAQHAITNSHFFKEGVKVSYQPTFDSLVTFEDYGDQMVWDYSTLPNNGESYQRVVRKSSQTPFADKFPESNYTIVGQDNDCVYLNVELSKTEFIGFVPPDSSYLVYNYQPWSISIHPMNFGDSIQSPISRYIEVGERKIYREGKVSTTAIGLGQLILPHGIFENVLKIKEVQVFYNPAHTTFYQATTYHWLSNQYNFPLMSCNKIIDRNSKGEEQITQFAQFILDEKNTNNHTLLQKIEAGKPIPKKD